jgi:hypothetical protein
VAEGDQITSTQYVRLARAGNDRLRLLGDLTWRLHYFYSGLWRQVRNPDESRYAFPPQAEWDEIYAHIDPDYADIQWPVTGPGEPEGANLANPMMQAVYGIEGGPDDEPSRITLPMAAPTTPRDYWALGKHQRGAYVAASGAQNAPAFEAGLSIFSHGFPWLSPMHKSYGGWAPMPVEISANCGPDGDPGEGIPNHEIKFTALNPTANTDGLHGTLSVNGDGRAVCTYAGSCPCGSADSGAGHVQQIVRHPLYYIVYVSQGDGACTMDVDYLSTRDWIEGPNEGEPYLTHQDGGQLHRAAAAMHADFKGSSAQRSGDDWQIEDIAFDNEAFFSRQYPLAPARGRQVGGMILAEYPVAVIRPRTGTSVAEGTQGEFSPGRTQYATHDQFVIAGLLIRSTGLTGTAILDVMAGDRRIAGAVLTEAEPDAVRWLPTAVSSTEIRVRLLSGASFADASGRIEIEFAELLSWKPYYWDAMVCSRNAGTAGGGIMTAGTDGRGTDCETAADMVEQLHKWGCLLNPEATAPRPQADWVNDNPLYDAARRLTRSHVRRAARRQLVGYEVTNGKSVLYFRRYAYGMRNSRLDMWDGIAPPLDPVVSGDLLEGETYIVHGTTGSVTYRGGTYRSGATFRAGTDHAFQRHGDCQLYIYDGIRHAARKGGTTNEWVMLLETHCYHPSVSSIWKADAYSDYWAFNQRCLFYPWTAPLAVRRHVSYNYGVSVDGDEYRLSLLPMAVQATLYSPEAPSSFSFSAGTNAMHADEPFCRSCQIWTAPYEIESCTVDSDRDGDQVIKVTFTGRFRSHADAPSSVARDVSTWSAGEVSDLRAEDYRTDDSAMREYVRHQYDPGYHCSIKVGDAGANSTLWGSPDAPFGSCYPTFLFAHLIPEPYDDGNNLRDQWDSRCTTDAFTQIETFLRTASEAFVDGRTSADVTCRTGAGGLYDYTFENLCYDAFAGRSIGAMPLSVRPEGEPGFGPVPNTVMYAEVFNRMVKAINLLTRIRVDIPFVVAQRFLEGTASTEPTVTPSGASCSTTGAVMLWADRVTAPTVPQISLVAGPWDTGLAFEASQVVGMTGCPAAVANLRKDVEWKVEADTVFDFALPDWLQEMIDASQVTLVARVVTTTYRKTRTPVGTEAEGDPCCDVSAEPCPGHWHNGAGTWYQWIETQTETEECILAEAGIVIAPLPPRSDYALGRDSDMPESVWCGPTTQVLTNYTLYDDTLSVTFALV